MAYHLINGSKTLIDNWNYYNRRTTLQDIANALKIPIIHLMGDGKYGESINIRFGEKEYQDLAAAFGSNTGAFGIFSIIPPGAPGWSIEIVPD